MGIGQLHFTTIDSYIANIGADTYLIVNPFVNTTTISSPSWYALCLSNPVDQMLVPGSPFINSVDAGNACQMNFNNPPAPPFLAPPPATGHFLPTTGGTLTGDLTLTGSAKSGAITLSFDEATGDLFVYNTDRSKSINITNSFIGKQNVTSPGPGPTAPVLTSISPSSVPAGSPDTVITFNGSGFTSSMKPGFGDHLMSWTTQMINPLFVSSTQFQATLGANLLAYPTSFFLFLINTGAQDSNDLEFDVT